MKKELLAAKLPFISALIETGAVKYKKDLEALWKLAVQEFHSYESAKSEEEKISVMANSERQINAYLVERQILLRYTVDGFVSISNTQLINLKRKNFKAQFIEAGIERLEAIKVAVFGTEVYLTNNQLIPITRLSEAQCEILFK